MNGAIGRALDTPGIRGFSLRVPWRAIDSNFALLDQGLAVARSHGVAFSIRFMAGRHTPERVFTAGSPFYLVGGQKVPAPFHANGSPNTVFEREWQALVQRLAQWSRANGVRLLHLAWYGQDWAELNHGREVREVPGYTYERWLQAHLRLIDLAVPFAGADLSLEAPLSGYGPLTDAALSIADHVIAKLGANSPAFFVQANGWGPSGDWGAPDSGTEAAFDRVWQRPVMRGEQAIQPGDYDWANLFGMLRQNRATYAEVYIPSFSASRGSQLAAEIARFASEC